MDKRVNFLSEDVHAEPAFPKKLLKEQKAEGEGGGIYLPGEDLKNMICFLEEASDEVMMFS